MEGIFDLVGFASRRIGHALLLSGVGWDVRIKSKRHLHFRCARGAGRISLRVPGQVLVKLPLGVPVPGAKAFRDGDGFFAVDPHDVFSGPAITRCLHQAGVRRVETRGDHLELSFDDHSDWRVTSAALAAVLRLSDAIVYARFGAPVFRLGLALGRHEAFGVIAGRAVRLRFAHSGADLFVHARGREFHALAGDPAESSFVLGALRRLGAHIAPDGVHSQTPPLSPEALLERVEALVLAAEVLDDRVAARLRRAS